MAKKLDTPYIEGSEGEPFDLSGPFPDGVIGVCRQGENLIAAKLRFKTPDKGRAKWEWDPGHTVYWDEVGKSLVDIRAAVKIANQEFPHGPEKKVA